MSPTHTPETTVTISISVEASAERAFETFTAGIWSWWPADHHVAE